VAQRCVVRADGGVEWDAALKMREYQHIALDWMIALYDKGLNGILADEMGLGKTIMTISVLAHLACERGIWGPHLIVVPTTLLLNWEMELKRWCPSFKVLTYYGSQKERKAKRQGWSKPNSFHVCVTSYKMVVQDQKMFRRKKWSVSPHPPHPACLLSAREPSPVICLGSLSVCLC
jgi:SNF2 family DNA or RNA helicase